jgi:hypothetical protein
MDEFDRRMREALLAVPPDWQARAARTIVGVKTMYEQRRKRAAMWTWIGTGIGICLMFLGIGGLIFGVLAGDVLVAIVGAMMFLFGDGWITGSKLLYWTWNTRIQLQRDIKEVHADVLEVLQRLERVERTVKGNPAPEAQ